MKRTPLQRKTPLRSRQSTPAPFKALRANQPSSRQRAAKRQEGRTRAILAERSAGLCEMCSHPLHDGLVLSHRRHDGMGGAGPENALPSNALASCKSRPGRLGCNDWCETPDGRNVGREMGWVLSRSDDPTQRPAFIHSRQDWFLLGDDGSLTPEEPS